jgi:alpha-ribazole phosphatase
MLELYFIRHGQTELSRENRFCGSIDPPLSELGVRMAEAFGQAYAHHAWAAVYSSPMLRTKRTAEALTSRVTIPTTFDDGLREVAYGEWEGLRHEDVKERWPEAYEHWARDPASRGTPGGETAFQVAARAVPVIERIREKHEHGRVLVVSHKATIRILACSLLGLDVRLFRDRIAQPVAAITRFNIGERGPLLVQLGDVAHLPPDLREAEGT